MRSAGYLSNDRTPTQRPKGCPSLEVPFTRSPILSKRRAPCSDSMKQTVLQAKLIRTLNAAFIDSPC